MELILYDLRLVIGIELGNFIVDFFFWNTISTILGWLICSFPSQLSTFWLLHVILHFHNGKGIHNLNDPLHFSCMLSYLGCKMCLFQKLYVEGFVDSLAAIVFHLVDLELITVFLFPHLLIRIIDSPYLHFLSSSMLAWRRISFPALVWSRTKYLWTTTQNSVCLFPALKHWWMSFSSSFQRNKVFWSNPVRLMWRNFFFFGLADWIACSCFLKT